MGREDDFPTATATWSGHLGWPFFPDACAVRPETRMSPGAALDRALMEPMIHELGRLAKAKRTDRRIKEIAALMARVLADAVGGDGGAAVGGDDARVDQPEVQVLVRPAPPPAPLVTSASPSAALPPPCRTSGQKKRKRREPEEESVDKKRKEKGATVTRSSDRDAANATNEARDNGTPEVAMDTTEAWQTQQGGKARRRARQPVDNAAKKPSVKPTRNAVRDERRVRPEALKIASTGKLSYAEILKRLRTDPALKQLFDDTQRVRKTRTGELLVEVGGAAEVYKAAVATTLSDAATVSKLQPRTEIVIFDLDEAVDEAEVRQALITCAGDVTLPNEDIWVRGIWPTRTGTYRTAVSLPVAAATKVVQTGKVQLGWVQCRVKVDERVREVRCYKCAGLGHQRDRCVADADWSALCLKCGKEGHRARECSNQPHCLACGGDHGVKERKCPPSAGASAGEQAGKPA